jgi:putative thiamine transport system permease protein
MSLSSGDSAWLRLFTGAAFIILLLPTMAGVVSAFLSAFGYSPGLGGTKFSIEPWLRLLETPGLVRSTVLTIWIGLASTAISLAVVIVLLAQFHDSRLMWLVRRTLSPLLSVPHVAIAIGLAFVIAPSGLFFRMLAQIVPVLNKPPDILIVHDTWGFSLIAALVIKEAPFLFLMSLAALPQARPGANLSEARTMGYRPSVAWLKVVLPRLYPQIRYPVLAVLAYSLSVVDASLVLGPTTPPPLAVTIFKWMNDPELTKRFPAAAGAVLLLGITISGLVLWLAMERLAAWTGTKWAEAGDREQGATGTASAAYLLGGVLFALVLSSAAAVLLWSFAGNWPYPNVLPDSLNNRTWEASSRLMARPLLNAFLIGLCCALIAILISTALLERDVRRGLKVNAPMRNLLYVPLLVPQIAFLPGLQILLLANGFDSNIYAVAAAHLVFVLPYVYLSLSEPWSHFDDRYRQAALSMGATPLRVLLRVRLPMLLAALLTAAAVGFAVSIGQYLPTLLLGSGRVPTITTEAVALSSGGDRRFTAALVLLQSLLPFVAFVIAIFLPLALYRNRRGGRSA